MKVDRECPVCGRTYQAEAKRLEFGRQTTCSRGCSYRLRAAKLERGEVLRCATCGGEFRRAAAHIKGKHGSNFCSPACHYRGRGLGVTQRIIKAPYKITEQGRAAQIQAAKKGVETRRRKDNYGHSDSTRSKLSHATSAAIADGRIPRRSKIEDKVAAALDAAGIEFIAQFPLRNSAGQFVCVFDFLLPCGALEVNGTFWHADPRFFPDGPAHPVQKRNAVAWERKMAAARAAGIPVTVIWEHDIRHDLKRALLDAGIC